MKVNLINPQQAKPLFDSAWQHAKTMLMAGNRLVLEIRPQKRTSEQNRLMWPVLAAFSAQKEWPVNGMMQKLEPEDWKDILTAGYKKESIRMAQGVDGGIVLLGLRTSKMRKDEFSDFIEFLFATAAHMGVNVHRIDLETGEILSA